MRPLMCLHLHALRERLDAMLAREGRLELAQACFEFLPTRASSICRAGIPKTFLRIRNQTVQSSA